MLRKLFVTLVSALLIALFTATPVLAAKSYYAERFDVDIAIQENGSIIVTETVEFHFEGDPFTFAFREISAAETDGLTFLDASMDGVPMPLGTQAGQVEVSGGDPLQVKWHFPATSNASRVFTVRYRVEGVIRKGEADTLIWRAIPEDHDYAIQASTITLTFPPQAVPLESPRLNRDFESVSTAQGFTLIAGGLDEDQDLILTVGFPPNSLTRAVPLWQTRQEQTKAATSQALPVGLLAGAAAFLLGGFGLWSYARASKRELNLSDVMPTPNPPSDLPPAVMGALTGQSNGFMGAIFDLASRGVLEIEEQKGAWGTVNYVLARRQMDVPVRPHEQSLLDALYDHGGTEINMNEIATRQGMKGKAFDQAVEEELVQRGWFDLDRKRTRRNLAAGGIAVLLLSIMIFIGAVVAWVTNGFDVTMSMLFAGITGLGAGTFLLSIILLIYAGTYSTLTPAGEEQAVRWKGFQEYLKLVSKGRETAIRPDFFEMYLAYAAVFGLGAQWAKYFQKMGDMPLPIWLHAAAGVNTDFGAMVAVMSASDTAGVSAGGDGGGGASGGGSSGAG